MISKRIILFMVILSGLTACASMQARHLKTEYELAAKKNTPQAYEDYIDRWKPKNTGSPLVDKAIENYLSLQWNRIKDESKPILLQYFMNKAMELKPSSPYVSIATEKLVLLTWEKAKLEPQDSQSAKLQELIEINPTESTQTIDSLRSLAHGRIQVFKFLKDATTVSQLMEAMRDGNYNSDERSLIGTELDRMAMSDAKGQDRFTLASIKAFHGGDAYSFTIVGDLSQGKYDDGTVFRRWYKHFDAEFSQDLLPHPQKKMNAVMDGKGRIFSMSKGEASWVGKNEGGRRVYSNLGIARTLPLTIDPKDEYSAMPLGKGTVVRFRNKVTFAGHEFVSMNDAVPLAFLLTWSGLTHLYGNGEVTGPDGQILKLESK